LEHGLAALGAGQNLGKVALCPIRDETVGNSSWIISGSKKASSLSSVVPASIAAR
jgi:hypothetical protein